jgi:hypothetical protein
MATITASFTASGSTCAALGVPRNDAFDYTVAGTWTGDWVLESTNNNGLSWDRVASGTVNVSATRLYNEERASSYLQYRFRAPHVHSGSMDVTLADVATDVQDQGRTRWENREGDAILEIKEDGCVLLNPITLTGLTANGVVTTNSSSQLTSTALTHGQIMIGSTGAAPAAAVPTAGTGISVTPGPGTITIAATPGSGVGTLCDVYDGAVKVVDNAEAIKFESGGFAVTASGTTALVSVNDAYDATFIVGSTVHCTHPTLAAALSAITGPALIRITAGEHSLGSGVTIPTAAGTVRISGAGDATVLKLDNTTNPVSVIGISGTGTLILDNFTVDGNSANNLTPGAGIGINLTTNLTSFVMDNVVIRDCRGRGLKMNNGATEHVSVSNLRVSDCLGIAGIEMNTRSATTPWKFSNVTINGCTAGDSVADYSTKITEWSNLVLKGNYSGYYTLAIGTVAVINGLSSTSHTTQGIASSNGRYIVTGGYLANNTTAGAITGPDCQLNNVDINNNGTYGVSLAGDAAVISGNRIKDNTSHAIYAAGGTSTDGCVIKGNAIDCTGAAGGIVLSGANVTKTTVMGNSLNGSGGGGAVGIQSAGGADYSKVEGNVFTGTFTGGEYSLTGVNDRVHDPCDVRGEFLWNIADGTATKTLTGLGTGSCPTSFEFYAWDDADRKVFSRGSDDGTYADCMSADENSVVQSSGSGSIWVQNAAGDGFAGLISLLGAAGGTAQDQFAVSMTQIGGGRDITVRYKAWR